MRRTARPRVMPVFLSSVLTHLSLKATLRASFPWTAPVRKELKGRHVPRFWGRDSLCRYKAPSTSDAWMKEDIDGGPCSHHVHTKPTQNLEPFIDCIGC